MSRLPQVLIACSLLVASACKGGAALTTQPVGDTGWVIDLPSGYTVGPDGTITDGKGEWGQITESSDTELSERRAMETCGANDERKVEKLPNGMVITCHSSAGYASRAWIKAGEDKMKICYWEKGATQEDARATCASLRKK